MDLPGGPLVLPIHPPCQFKSFLLPSLCFLHIFGKTLAALLFSDRGLCLNKKTSRPSNPWRKDAHIWLGQKAGNSSQGLGQGEVQFPYDKELPPNQSQRGLLRDSATLGPRGWRSGANTWMRITHPWSRHALTCSTC